jgi:hypothetical protein
MRRQSIGRRPRQSIGRPAAYWPSNSSPMSWASGENARGLAAMLAESWPPLIIRVKPERVTSYDYAKDGWLD